MKLFQGPLNINYEVIRKREESILQAEHALNTRIAYASAWRSFSSWCEAAEVERLPATTQSVRDFLTWCIATGYRLETVTLRASAIAYYHKRAGIDPNPVDSSLRQYIQQARRDLREQPRVKRALGIESLRRIGSRLTGGDALCARDRAMFLLCFAAGWRRSEIVALQTSDVNFVPQGIELWQRFSKVDQTAEGRLVGIEPGKHEATCPVRALQTWMQIRGDWNGPLFVRFSGQRRMRSEGISSQAFCTRFKEILELVGENPANFGLHSLRAGMVTEASKNGASEASIMQRTGHRSSRTLQRYIRPVSCFDFNPLAGVL